ncbi:ABC transporter substrate-binding protein [Hyalangium sp.]|uniref:ABC transporter substrate-binding protein n=1 Tax=Hyalangium sp. TaxID=2028555 RepID=UPI002D5CC806|nr:ABC transporter substrate-binding protein [Hyalangium sp.]HYH96914.1 ABC transporter substrate-binding protein [Hyalangium sp.]
MKPRSLAVHLSGALLSLLAGVAFANDKPPAKPATPTPPKAATLSDEVIKVGVLTDFSGVYSDLSGQGSLIAAQLAVDEATGGTGKLLGKKVELVSADHQNKADIAASKARTWFDVEKVDAIFDLTNSATALAVQELGKEKGKVVIVTGAGSTALTGKSCSPTGIHWMYDTYSLATGTGAALLKEGGDSWYFLTADYAFGHALESDTSAVIKAQGGKVLGTSRHPLNTNDFSSYLLKAQASGAKILGLANAGGDLINSVKQAKEFGLVDSGQRLAGLLVFITDIHSLGLETTQGMYLTEGFYWDLDDKSRAWSKSFFERAKKQPTMTHAGVYSSLYNYLKAIEATGTDDAGTVIKHLRTLTINDPVIRNGKLREDGRLVHDMYLLQVKKPSESKKPWDYYSVKQTIPGEQAVKSLALSECPLIKK